MSVAIIAALPREITALVAGLRPDAELAKRGISLYRVNGNAIAAGGMGATRVSMAVQAALAVSKVEVLISVGLAGSCSPQIKAGTLLRPGLVIDVRTGERFATSEPQVDAVLVSSDQIASAREKRRLHDSYGAAMVDMEAATVARLALAHNIGFRSIKGISDAHDFEIAALSHFANAKGQFQTLRFAAYTAARPHTWGSAIELGRKSGTALKLLTEALLPLINKQ